MRSRTQFWGLVLAMLSLNFIYALQEQERQESETDRSIPERLESLETPTPTLTPTP